MSSRATDRLARARSCCECADVRLCVCPFCGTGGNRTVEQAALILLGHAVKRQTEGDYVEDNHSKDENFKLRGGDKPVDGGEQAARVLPAVEPWRGCANDVREALALVLAKGASLKRLVHRLTEGDNDVT